MGDVYKYEAYVEIGELPSILCQSNVTRTAAVDPELCGDAIFQLSVFSFQLSVFSFQFSAFSATYATCATRFQNWITWVHTTTTKKLPKKVCIGFCRYPFAVARIVLLFFVYRKGSGDTVYWHDCFVFFRQVLLVEKVDPLLVCCWFVVGSCKWVATGNQCFKKKDWKWTTKRPPLRI